MAEKYSPGRLIMANVVGAGVELIAPGTGLAYRTLESIIYGTIVGPFFNKILHREKSFKEVYKDSPYDALGFFGGSYITAIGRYLL